MGERRCGGASSGQLLMCTFFAMVFGFVASCCDPLENVCMAHGLCTYMLDWEQDLWHDASQQAMQSGQASYTTSPAKS